MDMPSNNAPTNLGNITEYRIRKDAVGNLWFTEMMADRLGKVTLK